MMVVYSVHETPCSKFCPKVDTSLMHLLPQDKDLLLFLFGLMCKWGKKNFD